MRAFVGSGYIGFLLMAALMCEKKTFQTHYKLIFHNHLPLSGVDIRQRISAVDFRFYWECNDYLRLTLFVEYCPLYSLSQYFSVLQLRHLIIQPLHCNVNKSSILPCELSIIIHQPSNICYKDFRWAIRNSVLLQMTPFYVKLPSSAFCC